MINFQPLFDSLTRCGLQGWVDTLQGQISTRLDLSASADLKTWHHLLEATPSFKPSILDFRQAAIRIGNKSDISASEGMLLEKNLRQLHPWRKGPWDVFGIEIDTEWRSDWKWQRLAGSIDPLSGKNVLDIGCGNGYHCLRMNGAGAALSIGIDPYLKNVFQYFFLKKFFATVPVHVLPLAIEDLPASLKFFDTVFALGVLYHRRSPIDFIYSLRACLRSGGQLVLETLVIEGKKGEVLVPEGRYAKMRNVWFIPSTLTLEGWLKRCGLKDVQLIDVTPTTTDEQRSTSWMTFESLPRFLDPNDSSRTIEGYPAPIRAIFTAREPG